VALTFLHTARLWLLVLVPILYALHYFMFKKKKREAMKFSHLGFIKQAMGGKKSWRHKILFVLSLLTLSFLVLALADPHLPLKQTKEGVNLILVMDVSGSMQAKDYPPTRLEAAKKSAELLVENLKEQDHVGVVLFESGATTAAYLSPFKDKVIEKLRTIRAKEGKTAIGDGLALAVDMATSIPNKKRVIILLSDGVNNAGVISPPEAVLFAKTNKIQVNTIGLGSDTPAIIGYDFFGRAQYAELDEATLKMIAAETGGAYFKSVDASTLDDIYDKISKDIDREKEPTSIKTWMLIAGMLTLLGEFYLRYGWKRIIA